MGASQRGHRAGGGGGTGGDGPEVGPTPAPGHGRRSPRRGPAGGVPRGAASGAQRHRNPRGRRSKRARRDGGAEPGAPQQRSAEVKGRRGRGRGHRRGRGAGVRRAGPPAAAAGTAHREGKGRLPSKASSPLCSRPVPWASPHTTQLSGAAGARGRLRFPRGGAAASLSGGKRRAVFPRWSRRRGRRKIHILLRP